MKVLITGSSGRVGAAIAAELSIAHEIIGLDMIEGRWTTIQGSINDPDCLGKVVSEVEAIIHTASLHAPHVGYASEAEFIQTNVQGTELLLAIALKSQVKRFIYTSTTSLYGHALAPRDKAVWVTEELTPEPRDIYDTTKIAAEQACRQAAEKGLPCLSLRISRCFPEPESTMAIYRLYRGVDLRDVAQAHRLALTKELDSFDIFNISASSPFKKTELRELLTNPAIVIDRYFPWAPQAFQARGWVLPDSIDRVYVIEKAKELLGYTPLYNFDSLFN